MRGTVAKSLRRLAGEMTDAPSRKKRMTDGSLRWTGINDTYKRLKKGYRKGGKREIS